MISTTNAFRRAAAGAALVLSALAVPATTAHAATPPASAASTTASAVYGPYSDLRYCVPQTKVYAGSYCFLRNGRWYLYVP
ncbi:MULTISPECIES: hypothetical protein [unclassified Microbispora]|uniref:hypothetical protein n=1 Tax=unclassified Microbispora TaxID=2614687 RepID=UPI0014741048|nr:MULTISPECIES: hypothetical protein [unclassified Microbispora]